MITTQHLSLIAWDQESDDFEHDDLFNNFVRIDVHDHTGVINGFKLDEEGNLEAGTFTEQGKGIGISTQAIKPEAVVRWLIKLRAVGYKQIDIEGVRSENIKKKNVKEEHLDDESVSKRTIKQGNVSIDKFAPDILTLGSIILWYRPPGSSNEIGDLWHVCDGTAWASITGNKMGANETELTNGTIPDLRSRFARGTDVAHVGENLTGGAPSINLTHSHTVSGAALAHTHLVPAHVHGLEMLSAGAHTHTFAGGNQMRTRQNAFIMGLTFKDASNVTRHNSLESLFVAAPQYQHDADPGEFEEPVLVDFAGVHTHGGTTTAGASFNSGNWQPTNPGGAGNSITTENALTGVDTTPPYFGLVYIMRVR